MTRRSGETLPRRAGRPRRTAPPAELPEETLAVAEIVAPHGLEGGLKALILTDFPEDLPRRRYVVVDKPHRRWVRLTACRPMDRFLLIEFEGVEDRNTAEGLRGAIVSIPRAEAHVLPEGHYYVSDILGMQVFTVEGRSLGTIKEVQRTGSNDVYQTERALVPAIKQAVVEFDVPGRRMVVKADLVVEL